MDKQINFKINDISGTPKQMHIAALFVATLSIKKHGQNIIIEKSIEDEIAVGYITEKGETVFSIDSDGDSCISFNSKTNVSNNSFASWNYGTFSIDSCMYYFLHRKNG